MNEIIQGAIYRHFKGNLYQIVTVAKHSETQEMYVVYQALYGDMQVWVRPYEMFISEVDHDKYPEVKQKYRFELVNTIAGGIVSQSVSRTEIQKPCLENKIAQPQTELVRNEKQESKVEDEGRVDERLLKFLDAETCQEKINYLNLIRNNIDDRLINDIAAAMDLTVDEGPIDTRFFSLKNCLMMKAKYECGRRV